MFTIPCDNAEASNPQPVKNTSTTSRVGLGIDLDTLRDIWAYISPDSEPVSSAISTAHDCEVSDTDSRTTILSPWDIEAARSTFSNLSSEPESRPDTPRPSPAHSTSTSPIHFQTTQSPRVKRLLRASGLSVRTHDLDATPRHEPARPVITSFFNGLRPALKPVNMETAFTPFYHHLAGTAPCSD
ncbi:hypothetical protein BU25DRAFT_453213 [Macroventuria anomochaeta]|uniref:Uncharacterized protein n=1 Tax=Macroventuria anomochaeta TaxID=301207 RepID=A0ACB6SJ57_9PLEO|nr:uncharacterized protein BU25DRAFT_453213 [Macroventuria anomochaeta]KAF2633444.1 hypothetical protein BU25DRAFT_453213 [Macroventuria anomochaeta]